MTSEMRERIARALCSRQCVGVWEGQSSRVQEGFLLDALAVMKAMREPTTPMIEAGGNYVLQEGGIDPMHVDDRGPPYCIKGRETGSYELWRVMVAAEISLAEGGSRDCD